MLTVDKGFSIGNAHSSFYNGSRFAEATGAIIVTLTYRLNVFGFPGAPGNVQNLGLRDQRRAVEWAYQDRPLVSGIISESGNAFSFPLNTHEQQTKNWYNVSATLGCRSSGDTLDCVRAKDWKVVLAAAAKLPATPGGNPVRSTPAFYPTVDNVTVFSGYASLLKQGKFAKIVSPSEPDKIPITWTLQ
jgi:cholinesterase